eukprot:gene609-659_t
MNKSSFYYFILTTLLFLLYHDHLFVQCQRQSSKKRPTAPSSSSSSSDSSSSSSSDKVRRGATASAGAGGGGGGGGGASGGGTTADYEIDFLGETDITARDSLVCPPFCPHRNYLTEEALLHYWNGEMNLASACACHALKKNFQDQLARAILISLRSSPMIEKEDLPGQSLPLLNPQRYTLSWEILGPINVGKLELDGDPTFDSMEFRGKFHGDLGRYLLAMRKNVTVASDLVPHGEIHWQKATMQQNGQVDVHFPINWNDLVQGLSTLAVYELQGWARTTHYIAKSGVYLIDCQGTHTVYLHNDDQTRLFVGDVYHARQVRATMELKAGLLGVLLPLRISLQTAFRCEVQPAPEAVIAYTTEEVPYIVELPTSSPPGGAAAGGGGGMGYLLSGVFAVRIYNPFPQAITLEYAVEKPFGIEGDWIVREAVVWEEEVIEGLAPRHTSIAPGQILSLPLTLVQTSSSSSSVPPRLPCRSEKITFRLTFHPSKGPSSQVNVELGCRRLGISALSHAEAHKVMLPGSQDYTFGLLGYYLLAPSRFGAHNWESTGYLTAYYSMVTLPRLLGKAAQIPDVVLPKVDVDVGGGAGGGGGGGGLVSGHSMGGHGAWLLATHHPGAFTCVAPLGSWIKKEEYGQGNAFYTLDISSSYSTPRLRQLLAMGMVENHVDQLLPNLQGDIMDVFQRVGSHDVSTHPWYSRRHAEICGSSGSSPVHPLSEKTLTTSGPLRHVAHRPLVIVYGTTPTTHLPLRRAMRDIAIYLANSYYAAYHSYVPVLSDIDFRMSTFQKRPLLPNIIFIGGDSQTNRMWKWMQNDSSISPLTYRLPADLVMHGYPSERGQQQQEEEEGEEEGEEKVGFTLANQTFSRADHGLMFTFPIHRPPSSSSSSYDSVAMGVCLHGNSPRAYLHLSRLLWPVIPPMVRPPFSLYLPDYLVVDEEVWAKGPGGLRLAGYWDSDWQIDERTAYYRPSYSS